MVRRLLILDGSDRLVTAGFWREETCSPSFLREPVSDAVCRGVMIE